MIRTYKVAPLDWMTGFIDTLYMSLWTTGNYSSISISTIYSSLLHTLVSSVYYPLHWSFPGNGFITVSLQLQHTMKSSLYSLNPFLPFILNYSANFQLRRRSQFSAATADPGTELNSTSSCLRSSLYNLGVARTKKINTASSTVACWFTAAQMCLPHCCVATRLARTTENTVLLLLRALASVGMYLPSRCIAMNYSWFQTSCHSINQ
jgi:hypothetical protein